MEAAWAGYVAPTHYHSENFRKATLFLLVRWLPTTWWFSCPFMLRNLLVSDTSA